MAKLTITEKFLRQPQFRLPEALAITDVDRRRLFQWHNRGLAPEPRPTTGRGIRRLYSVRQLAHTYVLRLLADMAVPMDEAYKVAADAVDVIERYIFLYGAAKRIEDFDHVADCACVLWTLDGRWARQWFGMGEPVPPGGVQRWLRDLSIEAAIVLDLNSITLLFWKRALETLDEREAAKV